MVKVLGLIIALVALYAEKEGRKLPQEVATLFASQLGIPQEKVKVRASVERERIRRIEMESEGGSVPLELFQRLKPIGRRPTLAVEVREFVWEAKGLEVDGLKVSLCKLALHSMELDALALAEGRLRVGRLGEGRVEVRISPQSLVRALARSKVGVSSVEFFPDGTLGIWTGPRGLETIFVRVKPVVIEGEFRFEVREAKAGFVPIPSGVVEALLGREGFDLGMLLPWLRWVRIRDVRCSPLGLTVRGEIIVEERSKLRLRGRERALRSSPSLRM